jgi:hypothetical protein
MEVQHMGLSARERQALASIEDGLAGSDPDLVARLDSLSRLVADEETPAPPKQPTGWLHAVVSSLARWLSGSRGGRRTRARSRRGSAILAIWLAISCAMIATAVTLSHVANSGACAAMLALHCDSPAPAGPPQPSAR